MHYLDAYTQAQAGCKESLSTIAVCNDQYEQCFNMSILQSCCLHAQHTGACNLDTVLNVALQIAMQTL